jgi:hypothetical protein
MRNSRDALLVDLATPECICVRCKCGRQVQIAHYHLIGHYGIAKHTNVWIRDRFRRATAIALRLITFRWQDGRISAAIV